MLRTQEMVPDYYIEKSRDFQVLCRLYDFTLNALKYNIDTMQSLTDTKTVKDTALPLVGDKFGIYNKESYSNRELLEALPIAIKYKGSLKSVKILINAFLDSLDIFDFAVAYHTKDEESAKEISEILRRDIRPYSIVIVLSSFPSLTNLKILNEYMKMVIPSGMIVEYAFGVSQFILTKFKYTENIFLFYTSGDVDGLVKNHADRYFVNVPEYSLIKNYKDTVNPSELGWYELVDSEYKLTEDTVPNKNKNYFRKNSDFVKKVARNIDINSVGIAGVEHNRNKQEEGE